MQLLGQLAVGALDVVLRSRAVDVQQRVGILHGLLAVPPWSRARSGPGVGKEGIATIPPPDLTPKRMSMRLMPVAKAGPSSVENLPGAVGLAAGDAEGLLFLAADDDGDRTRRG